MAVLLVVLSFANGGTLAYAAGNQATLIVVGDSQKKVILCPKVVNLDANETAYDMLKKELGDKVASSSFAGKPYVTGIDGLKEYDDGPQSGWMYEINGKSADVGASDYIVKNNDVIAYRYTLNWGTDLLAQTVNDSIKGYGACTTSPTSPTSPTSTQTPVQATQSPTQTSTVAVDAALKKAIDFTLTNGIQSDWQAIALTRATDTVSSDVKNNYLQKLADRVQNSGRLQGTYLASTILAVNAVGGDATNIAGQNLISKLYNDSKVNDIYAYTYALLALDSKDYSIPSDATWNREKLIAAILKTQTSPGKWTEDQDPDTNAMVLMALAVHQDNSDVAAAVKHTVDYLKGIQLPDGGFVSYGNENSNSAAVVVTALSMMGIDPTGKDFTKNSSAVQNLLSFQLDNGGFKWIAGDDFNNGMAFDQAFYALVQYKYFVDGKGSIFHWTNTQTTDSKQDNPSVTPVPVSEQPKTDLQVKQEQKQEQVQQQDQVNNTSTEQQTNPSQAKEQKKQLPDTGLIGTDFWTSIAAGLLFIGVAMIALRNKVM